MVDNYQIGTAPNLVTPIYQKAPNMVTLAEINSLIDAAAAIAGNQVRLAELIGIPKNHITEMKKGRRPCNWRTRGKMRVITGEDPTHAFVAAMAEDLEASDHEDEKKAADGFKAMIAAFPNGWRKRRER
ncbi:hypothetical protein [Polaromonas sp. YR568]|uniref:hypothetical protein n=1 Tax=Polaromonas sp. YR568 TaxID=1855301 RepID=UPI00313833C2